MKLRKWLSNFKWNRTMSLIVILTIGLVVFILTLKKEYEESDIANPMLVDAKEKQTLYEIKNIVEEHSGDGDVDFTILDIVPSEFQYEVNPAASPSPEIMEISLTTMGYLVKGADPITDSLVSEFTKTVNSPENEDKYIPKYLKYGDRTDFAEKFVPVPSGTPSQYTLAYKEAYESIKDVSGAEWRKILSANLDIIVQNETSIVLAVPSATPISLPLATAENLDSDYGDQYTWLRNNVQQGQFYGKALKYDETTATSKAGYDYTRITGVIPTPEPTPTLDPEASPTPSESPMPTASPTPQATPQAELLYVGPGKGDYKLTETESYADNLYSVYNAPTYITCFSGEDLLKKYVFASLGGMENSSSTFRIAIKKVKAWDVTLDNVENADLIYLEDGLGRMVPSTYREDIRYLAKEKGAFEDMSKDVAFAILDRLVNEEKPVIVDHLAAVDEEHYFSADFKTKLDLIKNKEIDDKYTKEKQKAEIKALYDENYSYYQRLAMVLSKWEYDMYFYDLTDGLGDNDKKADKVFDIENIQNKYAKTDGNDYNHVHEHVYLLNDTSLLNGDYYFWKNFDSDYSKAGFQEILDSIKLENTSLSEDDWLGEWVSKARAIQYILCKTVAKFRDVKILELQPTANGKSDLVFTGYSKTSKKATLYWENSETKEGGASKGVILNSSNYMTANVNTVAVDQFNSDLEDINSEYTMIFIGLDGQKHNREKQDDGTKISLFNTESLKGLAYHSSKDGSYDGFDILPNKKDALIDYIKAGYPIVVEDACFTNKSAQNSNSERTNINTKYIQEGSNMYNFLKEAVSNSDYRKCIFTVSDARKSSEFLKEINLSRPYIEFSDELHKTVTRVDKPTGGEATAKIEYTISDGTTTSKLNDDETEIIISHGVYDGGVSLKLYFDYNGDGVFTDEEEAPNYSVGNGCVDINFGTVNKALIHYALKVESTDNSYRRDSITGYFNILDTDKTPMLILQIIADGAEGVAGDDSFKYNLFTAVTVDRNTAPGGNSAVIGYAFDAAEEMIGVTYGLVTATVSDVAAELADNPDYVREFDTLVLGFGPQYKLSDSVLDAVSAYINEGRAAVIGKGAFDSTALGLGQGTMYQTEERTYANIGQEGSYYRFNNQYAQGDVFSPKLNVILDVDNDGGIAHYPYEIGKDVTIAANDESAIRPNEYLLDFSKNISGTSLTKGISTGCNVTSFYTYGRKWQAENGTPYDVSPKNGRNNYYVYSRNNVYYIAASEYPFAYSKGKVPEEGLIDCEIFVNALMNAYNVSVKNPHVQIVSDYGMEAPQIDSITIPFDTATYLFDYDYPGDISQDVYMYFKFNDANVGYDKKYAVSFSYGDKYAGSEGFAPDIVGGDRMWRVTGGEEVPIDPSEIKPGVTYKIVIPSGVIEHMPMVYVTVETSFDRTGKHYAGLKSHDSAQLNKALLFMLE